MMMSLKKKQFIVLLVVGMLFCNFHVCAQKFSYPESVIRKGDFLYMSGDGKEPDPMKRNGDGVIIKMKLDGTIVKNNISLATLNSPKGTAIIDDVIYVADIDRVVGISLKTGFMVKTISFAGTTNLLNDIAVKDENTLFVSATDVNKIFIVSLKGNSEPRALNVPPIKGANGIQFDKKTNALFVVGFGAFTDPKGTGEIGKITWSGEVPHYEKLININGYFDGLQVVNENTLLVSDWVSMQKMEGKILEIDLSGNPKVKKEISVSGTPADFIYDKELKKIFIPLAMQSGFETKDFDL